jgi:hypothetical protein
LQIAVIGNGNAGCLSRADGGAAIGLHERLSDAFGCESRWKSVMLSPASASKSVNPTLTVREITMTLPRQDITCSPVEGSICSQRQVTLLPTVVALRRHEDVKSHIVMITRVRTACRVSTPIRVTEEQHTLHPRPREAGCGVCDDCQKVAGHDGIKLV